MDEVNEQIYSNYTNFTFDQSILWMLSNETSFSTVKYPFRIGASCAYDIYQLIQYSSPTSWKMHQFIKSLLSRPIPRIVTRGVLLEKPALSDYIRNQPGSYYFFPFLVTNPYLPFLCCKPDAILVSQDGQLELIEVKAPRLIKPITEDISQIRSLLTDDDYLRPSTKTYFQMQISMLLMNSFRSTLLIYDELSKKTIKIYVYRDPLFLSNIIPLLYKVHRNVFYNELLKISYKKPTYKRPAKRRRF